MNLKVASKAIIVYEGKVLIVSDEGIWDFPGGGIESNERLLDALKRELYEELALKDFTIGNVVHVDEWFIESRNLHVVGIFYLCKVDQRQEFKLSDEHSEYVWISPSEIQNYKATPDTLRALEAADLR